jgi:hypothetical protein
MPVGRQFSVPREHRAISKPCASSIGARSLSALRLTTRPSCSGVQNSSREAMPKRFG